MKDPTIPQFVVNTKQRISLTIEKTQAQLANQGYTYNEPGFTYNQAGVQYGGVYLQDQNSVPRFSNNTATLLSPAISSIIDIGGASSSGTNSGMLIGILGLTYP